MMRLFSAAGFSLVLAACGSTGSTSDGQPVSKAEFESKGLRWPLIVQSGKIGCDGGARWFEAGGIRYGLNGVATVEQGFTDIEPIWAEDAKMNSQLEAAGVTGGPPLRVSIGDMIEEAGKLCSG
jgi:hypothetical protein